jgi:ornithine cyclodeaminase/alanine dehydrogenase-like protein (mu-crystallin family)
MKTLLLNESDVAALLAVPDCIEALEDAFRRQDAGQVMNHPRRRLHAPDGTFHIMEAADLGTGRMAIKTYASFRPKTRFLILLYDTTSGDLLALIEADRLGQIRTGAATGVATRHMARADSRVLGLFGSGWQAETQAQAVAAVRPIEKVLVYSRTEERRADFVRRMAPAMQAEIVAVDAPKKAVQGADIVVTATTSRTPVFDGSLLTPGAHVNAVGSNSLARAEIDLTTVARAARIVVDSLEQAQMEAGDLLTPVEARKFRWEQARELREIVAGGAPGRQYAEEITLFKSVGVALEDVAAASLVYDRAQERGVGREIEFWP